jgi:cytochrome b561
MIGVRQRFTPLQRLLHWLMAVCILAMLFIGVGMVSTVTPKFLPLVAIHKSLGIAILVLALIRLAVRLRYGAPALPADLPEPMKLAAYLSHYALYALMIGMPLIGWAMLSAAAYPVVVFGSSIFRRSCRRATFCMLGSGTRISTWLSRFSAWS